MSRGWREWMARISLVTRERQLLSEISRSQTVRMLRQLSGASAHPDPSRQATLSRSRESQLRFFVRSWPPHAELSSPTYQRETCPLPFRGAIEPIAYGLIQRPDRAALFHSRRWH